MMEKGLVSFPKRGIYRIFFAGFLLTVGLSSCATFRHLSVDQEDILHKQSFVLEGDLDISKSLLRKELVRRRNRRGLFMSWWLPYVELHQWGLNLYDTGRYQSKIKDITRHYDDKISRSEGKSRTRLLRKKQLRMERQRKKIREGNFWMRVGRPWVHYDSVQRRQSEAALRDFLVSKGYFQAQVSSTVRQKKKRVYITYHITPFRRYVMDTLFYRLEDSGDRALGLSAAPLLGLFSQTKTPWREGMYYDQDLLDATAVVLERKAKNHGYYAFRKEDFRYWMDTTYYRSSYSSSSRFSQGLAAYVELRSLRPSSFRTYHIDTLSIHLNATAEDSALYSASTTGLLFNTKRYHRLLSRRILLREGDLYTQKSVSQTRFLLQSMNMFQTINILHDSASQALRTRIFLRTVDRYRTDTQWGLQVQEARLPSPFLSAALTISNLFHTMELIRLSMRFTLSGLGTPDQQNRPYRGYEFLLDLSVSYQDILFPFFFRSSQGIRWDRRTNFVYRALFEDRVEYLRNSNQLGMAYVWRLPSGSYIQWWPLDIGIIQSRVTLNFAEQVRRFYNSFSQSFVSSFVSTSRWIGVWDNAYLAASPSPIKGSYVALSLETGGHLGELYRPILSRNRLAQYRFTRMSIEYKQRRPLGDRMEWVWRFQGGVVWSHDAVAAVPYEKFFFAGGSNSIRGWRPRRLGPGGYRLPEGFSGTIEQPGEMKLETNIELRALLTSWLAGALFVDIGNIWRLRLPNANPSSVFRWPYSFGDIAVATGGGLRVIFPFLVVRFDVGIKTYDPSFPLAERWVIRNIRLQDFYFLDRLVLLNFGIGYPF